MLIFSFLQQEKLTSYLNFVALPKSIFFIQSVLYLNKKDLHKVTAKAYSVSVIKTYCKDLLL